MVTVVGVDPGLADTGFGIVAGIGTKIVEYSFGTIRTTKNDTPGDRLNKIYSKFCSILEAKRPDLIVMESVFSTGNYPMSGISLGRVCGVLLLAGARHGVETTEVAVREVKQVLTGNGSADKDQLERSVRHLLKSPTPISPSHASDALALALIGLQRHKRH